MTTFMRCMLGMGTRTFDCVVRCFVRVVMSSWLLLQHWRRWTCWTYQPLPTEGRPEGGDPDLIGMLRTRARDQVRFRDRFLPANSRGPARDRKVELYDEHIGTLLTLADAALPDDAPNRPPS